MNCSLEFNLVRSLPPGEKIKVVESPLRETIRTIAADRKVYKRMLRYQMRCSWECGYPA